MMHKAVVLNLVKLEAQSPGTDSSPSIDSSRIRDDETDKRVHEPRLMMVSPPVSSEREFETTPDAVDVPTKDPAEVTQQSDLLHSQVGETTRWSMDHQRAFCLFSVCKSW